MDEATKKNLDRINKMADHLVKTHEEFISNIDNNTKYKIDLDLILTEIKLVETMGRITMLGINAQNAVKRIGNTTRKIS